VHAGGPRQGGVGPKPDSRVTRNRKAGQAGGHLRQEGPRLWPGARSALLRGSPRPHPSRHAPAGARHRAHPAGGPARGQRHKPGGPARGAPAAAAAAAGRLPARALCCRAFLSAGARGAVSPPHFAPPCAPRRCRSVPSGWAPRASPTPRLALSSESGASAAGPPVRRAVRAHTPSRRLPCRPPGAPRPRRPPLAPATQNPQGSPRVPSAPWCGARR
jgi:hypothetical protein